MHVVHDKSSSGADVEATVLALDLRVCDSGGKPVTRIQLDSDHAAFAGRHVRVVLNHFITARSDDIQLFGVIGSSDPSDPDAVTAYDDNAKGLVGMSADEVEAIAGTPRLDLGGSEGEACFVFACNSRNKVCFAPGTEQASWKQVLRTKARVASVAPVSERDKASLARRTRYRRSGSAGHGAKRLSRGHGPNSRSEARRGTRPNSALLGVAAGGAKQPA